jgi:hypothetical protein
VEQLSVPELSAERCIVWLRPHLEIGSASSGS